MIFEPFQKRLMMFRIRTYSFLRIELRIYICQRGEILFGNLNMQITLNVKL